MTCGQYQLHSLGYLSAIRRYQHLNGRYRLKRYASSAKNNLVSIDRNENHQPTRIRIMTTTATTKTRYRVSAKSWLKTERKAAAKGIISPNRVARYYNTVEWAAHYRGRMAQYRASMLSSTSPGSIEVCLKAYLYYRNKYRTEIREFKVWMDVVPLP